MSKSFGTLNTALNFTEDSATGEIVSSKSVGGAELFTNPALNYVTYSDATYVYYCEAPPGTTAARASAVWQVSRKTVSTGDIIYAGTGKFEHAATSLAVVGALTYTLGA